MQKVAALRHGANGGKQGISWRKYTKTAVQRIPRDSSPINAWLAHTMTGKNRIPAPSSVIPPTSTGSSIILLLAMIYDGFFYTICFDDSVVLGFVKVKDRLMLLRTVFRNTLILVLFFDWSFRTC